MSSNVLQEFCTTTKSIHTDNFQSVNVNVQCGSHIYPNIGLSTDANPSVFQQYGKYMDTPDNPAHQGPSAANQTWWPPKNETVTRVSPICQQSPSKAPPTSIPSFENSFAEYLKNENVTRVSLNTRTPRGPSVNVDTRTQVSMGPCANVDTRTQIPRGPSANVIDAKPMDSRLDIGVSKDGNPLVWHQSRIQYVQGGYNNAYLLLHLLASKAVSDHKCNICNLSFYSNADMYLHRLKEQDKLTQSGHCARNCLSIGLDLAFTQRSSVSDFFVQTKLFPHLSHIASSMQSRFTIVKFNLQLSSHVGMSKLDRQKLYMDNMKRLHLSLVHHILVNVHLDIHTDCVYGFKHGIVTMVKKFHNESYTNYHKSIYVTKAINSINGYPLKRFIFNHIMVESSVKIYNSIFLKLNGVAPASLIDNNLGNHVSLIICLPNDVSIEGICSKYPLKMSILDYDCG